MFAQLDAARSLTRNQLKIVAAAISAICWSSSIIT